MVDTNSLLSIAFSIVASFTNVVYVPPEAVPMDTNDLAAFSVGRPYHPVDVYLKHKGGSEFWIMDGAVQVYHYTPGSYSWAQDPALIPQFLGPSKLGPAEALSIASSAVRRLIRTGNPLANITPVVQPAGLYKGQRIPFFDITWPQNAPGKLARVARVEVDARSGTITALSLTDIGFRDFQYADEISNRVYRSGPPRQPSTGKHFFPRPETNDVVRAIASWLAACQKLRIELGPETNLTDVDWNETYVYSSPFFYQPTPVTRVTLNSGAHFDCSQAGLFSYSSADCYHVPNSARKWRGKKEQFKGRILHHWSDLATAFEKALEREFSLPTNVVSKYVAAPMLPPLLPGSEGFARVEVGWCPRSKRGRIAPEQVSNPALMVEFDLRTGVIKGFGFREAHLIGAFLSAQSQGHANK